MMKPHPSLIYLGGVTPRGVSRRASPSPPLLTSTWPTHSPRLVDVGKAKSGAGSVVPRRRCRCRNVLAGIAREGRDGG